jgi:hypothetical protein
MTSPNHGPVRVAQVMIPDDAPQGSRRDRSL